jgi:hypothetical protein
MATPRKSTGKSTSTARARTTGGSPARARTIPDEVPNASVIVASARRFDLDSRDDIAQIKKLEQDWQRLAWTYFDTNESIGFALRYIGNMLSRLQLFPAYRPDPNSEPIPLIPDDPNLPPELVDIATAATIEVERLAGPTGDHGALMAPLAMNVSCVGEAWLAGIPDREEYGGEKWEVYSTDELIVDDKTVRVKQGPEDREGEALPPGTFFLRIWRRHPRWRNLADSSMRALLEACEELLLLSRGIRAGATQRLNAGIFLYPNEMTFIPRPDQPAIDLTRDPQQDTFMAALIESMTQPVMNPSHASALVPLLLKGPGDYLDKVRHLTIARPFDAVQLEQREELRRVIATGIDLPNEILLGMSDANHWTAWLVDEQTYKAHLDPIALLLLDALTKGWLHPALSTNGFLPRNVIIWRDPQDLIADNDQWPRALDAHKQLVISDAALRREGRFGEDDAPDDAELERRLKAAAPPGFGPPAGQPASSSNGPPGAEEDVVEGPPEETPDEAAARLTLVAAGPRRRPQDLERLSLQLIELDRNLRERIQARADTAVNRALEVAGARVKRRVQGGLDKIPDQLVRDRRATLKLQIAKTPFHLIAGQLGRTTCQALGLEEEDLIDEALGSIAALFAARTRRTYSEARRLATKATGRELRGDDIAALEERETKNIEAGFLVLSAAIGAAIRDRLFNPTPTAPPAGEFDGLVTVPPGQIREAMAVAGGAPTAQPDPVTGGPSGGVAAGEQTMSMLDEFYGVTAGGGRWVYGDAGARQRPFEPHELLDGVDFADWDDPVLTNNDSWPPFPFLFPGDHDYCQCDYIPALESGAGQLDQEA